MSTTNSASAIATVGVYQQRQCIICLDELTVESSDRSSARLICGHYFHLDCIGSLFNCRGTMQCPICRSTEEGNWRYATGSPSNDDADHHDAEPLTIVMTPQQLYHYQYLNGWPLLQSTGAERVIVNPSQEVEASFSPPPPPPPPPVLNNRLPPLARNARRARTRSRASHRQTQPNT